MVTEFLDRNFEQSDLYFSTMPPEPFTPFQQNSKIIFFQHLFEIKFCQKLPAIHVIWLFWFYYCYLNIYAKLIILRSWLPLPSLWA